MYKLDADRPANHGKVDTLMVHDGNAIDYLRGALKGFWVAAPMAWGVEQTILNKYTTKSGVDLTLNNVPKPSPHEALGHPQHAMTTMFSTGKALKTVHASTTRRLAALTLTICCGVAHAACHGTDGPLYAPTDRSPFLSGITFTQPSLEPNAPWYEGVIVNEGISLDRAKRFPAEARETSLGVIYTEPDAQGKPRICRVENWELTTDDDLQRYQRVAVRKEQERLLARSPGAIAAWNKYFLTTEYRSTKKTRHLYIASQVLNFYYQPDGKLSHIYGFNTDRGEKYDLNEHLEAYCFRYDKQSRISHLYTDKEKLGHHCENAEKQAADRTEFVYAHEVKPHIFYYENFYRANGGKPAEGFRESVGIPGMPRFYATWDSKDGLTKLESYGSSVADYGGQQLPWDKPDRSIYNQGPDGSKFWYFFPKPGPVKLLDDLTQITRYNRVRMSFPEYPANVTEVISSKGDVLARWFLDGGMRQDVMKNGKLWHVLIDDGVKHIGNKHTTWWYEDPEPLKAFAAKHRTQVEKLLTRVYEVDDKGKWTLLAAEWTRDPPLKPGEQRRNIYVLENGAETVDGKKTWRGGKPMLEAYGFDEAMTLAQKWGRFSPLEEPINGK
jgi:hypothetical protein